MDKPTEPLETQNSKHSNETQKPPSCLSVMFSAMAAAFGVQSRKNQQRDFSRGNIGAFIVAGVLCTGLFILGLALTVRAVLNSSGA